MIKKISIEAQFTYLFSILLRIMLINKACICDVLEQGYWFLNGT